MLHDYLEYLVGIIPNLIRPFIRSDELLNPNYGRSAIGAERSILISSTTFTLAYHVLATGRFVLYDVTVGKHGKLYGQPVRCVGVDLEGCEGCGNGI